MIGCCSSIARANRRILIGERFGEGVPLRICPRSLPATTERCSAAGMQRGVTSVKLSAGADDKTLRGVASRWIRLEVRMLVSDLACTRKLGRATRSCWRIAMPRGHSVITRFVSEIARYGRRLRGSKYTGVAGHIRVVRGIIWRLAILLTPETFDNGVSHSGRANNFAPGTGLQTGAGPMNRSAWQQHPIADRQTGYQSGSHQTVLDS
jgi:hypothetical protein